MFGGGSHPSAAEVGKEARKEIREGQRALERQERELERAEQKALGEARACARRGDERGARVAAGEVVRTREARARMAQAGARLGEAGRKTREAESAVVMTTAMAAATRAMAAANYDAKNVAATMREFEKQAAAGELRTEMLDDLFEGEEEEEADAEVAKIFEELSITATEKMESAPKHGIEQQVGKEQKVMKEAQM